MYSNYCRHSLLCTKIFCACVRVCYELSMSINIVQCSVHELKNKANRLVTRIHKVSPLSSDLNHTQPATFASHERIWLCRDPTWCWLLFITPRNHPTIKKNLCSDPLASNMWFSVTCHLTGLPLLIIFIDYNCPCWTNQRKIHTDFDSEQQQSGDFCVIELYDRYCQANQYFFCKSQTLRFDSTAPKSQRSFSSSARCKMFTGTAK